MVSDNQWDCSSIANLFGSTFTNDNTSLANIDYDSKNHWVWFPRSNSIKISLVVYH